MVLRISPVAWVFFAVCCAGLASAGEPTRKELAATSYLGAVDAGKAVVFKVDQQTSAITLIEQTNNKLHDKAWLALARAPRWLKNSLRESLRQVAASNKKNRWAFYKLVILLDRTGHALVSLSEAEKGLEVYQDFSELALFAANTAFKEKLYSRAEEHYKKASKLGSPNAVVGLENIRTIREND